jgi:hypothetical protein
MHRTGTSLAAGLLHRHGLWLGDEADMMLANPYNPDGYFENDRIVDIDDAILALFGGSWSSPPDLHGRWRDDPRLATTYKDARALGEGLAFGGRPWGFKDPRAALTLPFWLLAWGELTVIVTLRNPLETAQSLNHRDEITVQQGIELWYAYYRSLLAHTTQATRIVVEYEEFCADPVGVAGALLSRLPGLREVDADTARASVRSPLRHFRANVADLQAQGVPSRVIELYAHLQKEAIHPDRRAETASGSDGEILEVLRGISPALAGLDLAIRDVHVDLQRLAATVARLEGEVGLLRPSNVIATGQQEPVNEAAPDASVNGRR